MPNGFEFVGCSGGECVESKVLPVIPESRSIPKNPGIQRLNNPPQTTLECQTRMERHSYTAIAYVRFLGPNLLFLLLR
jgi:hypothetical protein